MGTKLSQLVSIGLHQAILDLTGLHSDLLGMHCLWRSPASNLPKGGHAKFHPQGLLSVSERDVKGVVACFEMFHLERFDAFFVVH